MLQVHLNCQLPDGELAQTALETEEIFLSSGAGLHDLCHEVGHVLTWHGFDDSPLTREVCAELFAHIVQGKRGKEALRHTREWWRASKSAYSSVYPEAQPVNWPEALRAAEEAAEEFTLEEIEALME